MFLFSAVACSKHWRDGDPGIADSDLDVLIQESLSVVASTQGIVPQTDVERFNNLFNQEQTTVYFAESGASMGPAQNIAAFTDWRFMGDQGLQQNGGSEIFAENIEKVRVIFLDLSTDQGTENALLIDVTIQGRRIVKFFFNDSQSVNSEPSYFDGGEFVSQMTASDGSQISVRSLDVEDDLLQSNIQLEVYDYITGEESLAGKFTTLVGFLGAQ